MNTVDSYECQSIYQSLKPKFQLHKSFLCAQGEGVGTCFGDGGSPLLCPNDKDDYVQVRLTEKLYVNYIFLTFSKHTYFDDSIS